MYQIRKLEIFSVNGSGNNSDSSSTQKNVLNKNLIIKIIVMKVLKSRIGRKTTMSAKITVEEIRKSSNVGEYDALLNAIKMITVAS